MKKILTLAALLTTAASLAQADTITYTPVSDGVFADLAFTDPTGSRVTAATAHYDGDITKLEQMLKLDTCEDLLLSNGTTETIILKTVSVVPGETPDLPSADERATLGELQLIQTIAQDGSCRSINSLDIKSMLTGLAGGGSISVESGRLSIEPDGDERAKIGIDIAGIKATQEGVADVAVAHFGAYYTGPEGGYGRRGAEQLLSSDFEGRMTVTGIDFPLDKVTPTDGKITGKINFSGQSSAGILSIAHDVDLAGALSTSGNQVFDISKVSEALRGGDVTIESLSKATLGAIKLQEASLRLQDKGLSQLIEGMTGANPASMIKLFATGSIDLPEAQMASLHAWIDQAFAGGAGVTAKPKEPVALSGLVMMFMVDAATAARSMDLKVE